MKKDLVTAYAAKRRSKTAHSNLELEPRESKGNLFSNEDMYDSPFQDEPLTDDEALMEHDMSVHPEMDNTKGNAPLEEIMRKIRMRNMRG